MCLRNICVFLILLCSYSTSCKKERNNALLENLLNFCEANGKKFITVTSILNDKEMPTFRQISVLFSLTQKRKIFTRFLPFNEVISQANFKAIESTIILTNYKNIQDENNSVVLGQYMKLISKTKVRSSILVISNFSEGIGNNEIKLGVINDALSMLRKNMFFYVLYDDMLNNGTFRFVWNQVITLQNDPKVVFNELLFDSESRVLER